MATIDIGLLLAAQKDGVFDRELTSTQQVFYKETVITALKVLGVVRSTGDTSSLYISNQLNLNQNTCKIYLRYLVQLGLLFESKSKSQGVMIFYKIVDSQSIEK